MISTPKRVFAKTLKPIGTIASDTDLDAMADELLRRIGQMRHATNAGCYVLGSPDGNVYVLAERASTTSGIVDSQPNHIVGLYASRWAFGPPKEQLLGDLRSHFAELGVIAGPAILRTIGEARTALVPVGDEQDLSGLVRYKSMCTAIAECHRVDEVKDIRDRARALEVYAQQARNTDAERKAAAVRLRAERRTGELLRDLERTEPKDRSPTGRAGISSNDDTKLTQSEYAETLERTGLSRQTAHRYQQLADVPAETFEAALADPEKVGASAIVNLANQRAQKKDNSAVRVWSMARDYERFRELHCDARAIYESMTDAMQSDIARIAQELADYWTEMARVSQALK
jgi:hypothetical protein